MTERKLVVSKKLWTTTWEGLGRRGNGLRETACVWAGTREGEVEEAREAIFLDDFPGTRGAPRQHRTSREAVAALFARARELGMVIVADIHTHPSDWVDLSDIDREHPIEYRVGLLALVLPEFALGPPDLLGIGVHEYAGDGDWRRLEGDAIAERFVVTEEGEDDA